MDIMSLPKIRVEQVKYYPKYETTIVVPGSSNRSHVLGITSDGEKVCAVSRRLVLITFSFNGQTINMDIFGFLRKEYPDKTITKGWVRRFEEELLGKKFPYDGTTVYGLDVAIRQLIG